MFGLEEYIVLALLFFIAEIWWGIKTRRDFNKLQDTVIKLNMKILAMQIEKRDIEHLIDQGLTPQEIAEKFHISASVMTLGLMNLYPNILVV